MDKEQNIAELIGDYIRGWAAVEGDTLNKSNTFKKGYKDRDEVSKKIVIIGPHETKEHNDKVNKEDEEFGNILKKILKE